MGLLQTPNASVVARQSQPALLTGFCVEVVLVVKLLAEAAAPRRGKRNADVGVREIQPDERELLRRAAREEPHAVRLIAFPVVVEVVVAVLQLRARPTHTRQASDEAQHAAALPVVEKLPRHWPKQPDPREASLRHDVVRAELLPLPQQRDALSGEQRD